MGGTAEVSLAEVGPGKFFSRVEHSQFDAGFEDAAYVHVDVGLCDQASFKSFCEGFVAGAALDVGAGQDCIGRSSGGVGVGAVLARVVEVADGAAVRHHDARETPFVAEDVLQQTVAAAAGLSFVALICTHNFLHVGFLDYRTEGRQVGLPEVAH